MKGWMFIHYTKIIYFIQEKRWIIIREMFMIPNPFFQYKTTIAVINERVKWKIDISYYM